MSSGARRVRQQRHFTPSPYWDDLAERPRALTGLAAELLRGTSPLPALQRACEAVQIYAITHDHALIEAAVAGTTQVWAMGSPRQVATAHGLMLTRRKDVDVPPSPPAPAPEPIETLVDRLFIHATFTGQQWTKRQENLRAAIRLFLTQERLHGRIERRRVRWLFLEAVRRYGTDRWLSDWWRFATDPARHNDDRVLAFLAALRVGKSAFAYKLVAARARDLPR